MREHHKESIANLVEELKTDETVLAVILSGSIAKGTEKEFSDIDVYIVVTEENFRERSARDDTSYSNASVCTYEGGYIDGKIIDMNILRAAAERGSEPMRASFSGSYAVFSRVEGIDEIIRKIQEVDEGARERKMDSFYAQVRLWYEYFYKEGIKKNNPYLTHRSIMELVFYASRYILEENHLLFPCHKDLMAQVAKAVNKPENYEAEALALLESPDEAKAERFFRSFCDFAGGRMRFAKALSLFVKDSEWNFLTSEPPLMDC